MGDEWATLKPMYTSTQGCSFMKEEHLLFVIDHYLGETHQNFQSGRSKSRVCDGVNSSPHIKFNEGVNLCLFFALLIFMFRGCFCFCLQLYFCLPKFSLFRISTWKQIQFQAKLTGSNFSEHLQDANFAIFSSPLYFFTFNQISHSEQARQLKTFHQDLHCGSGRILRF